MSVFTCKEKITIFCHTIFFSANYKPLTSALEMISIFMPTAAPNLIMSMNKHDRNKQQVLLFVVAVKWERILLMKNFNLFFKPSLLTFSSLIQFSLSSCMTNAESRESGLQKKITKRRKSERKEGIFVSRLHKQHPRERRGTRRVKLRLMQS
jgi:hypothetical protein